MKQWLTLGLAFGLGLAFAQGASAQIKLGVGGPMTGGSATFGAQLKNGTEQAVQDINAAGGILGQKIQVVVGDDRADPKEGVSVANDASGRKLKFLRRVPIDPMTKSTEWGLRAYTDKPDSTSWGGSSVFDVYSKSTATALDGTKYKDW